MVLTYAAPLSTRIRASESVRLGGGVAAWVRAIPVDRLGGAVYNPPAFSIE